MITNEMVEAAARALCLLDGKNPDRQSGRKIATWNGPKYPWLWEEREYAGAARAALTAALDTVKAELVAWEHVMFDETGEELRSRVTYAEGHPFGRPGVDFSEEFKIITTPLYAHPAPAIPPGWRLVPEDDPSRSVADSALPYEMIHAGMDADDQVEHDLQNYTAGVTTDWDQGMRVVAIYRAMLAAAPQPPVTSGSSACTAPSDRC